MFSVELNGIFVITDRFITNIIRNTIGSVTNPLLTSCGYTILNYKDVLFVVKPWLIVVRVITYTFTNNLNYYSLVTKCCLIETKLYGEKESIFHPQDHVELLLHLQQSPP